jgi:polysaccharide biosynthesis/export protein
MRTAIFSALLATASMVPLAGQQQPPQKPPQQDQKQEAKTQSQPQSISPLIPVANPADTATQSAMDPARMAAPSGKVGAAGAKPAPPAAEVDAKSYVIGADDELSIIVFENTGFNVPLETVRPDGKITMPLIGELPAAGKTPEQLRDEIRDVLNKNYMNQPPHVSVIVVRVLSKNYYINGEVNKPGKYTLTVPTTIMQALVNAGGFRDFANKKNIKIQRGDQFFRFNYNEVAKGKNLKQNIYLQPDDQIYVN